MTTPLDTMAPTEIGERLCITREAAKLTQAEVASSLKISRTTLVAIEQGKRRVRLDELQALANLYQTSVNALLRVESVHVDLAPRFRKFVAKDDSAVESAASLLSGLARAEVELENLLGVKRIQNYPPERPLLPGDTKIQAEEDAMELRRWLGLGQSPIVDIITLLEMELGIRVYVRRLQGKISGLFAYDSALGACMLLNANDPRERRTQTAAHELGHFVATRARPEVLDGNIVENSREERYATTFARSFLTPARAVMQKFKEVTAGSTKLTRRHVIVLAHVFGVSREAMVKRLEELSLTKVGTWGWFQSNGGITNEQARQVLGDRTLSDEGKIDADRPVAMRLSSLAEEARRQELLSEGQLARLLHLDRVELRRLFDGLDIEGGEADVTFLPR